MDYTKFKVEDFAADDLFIKWVMEKDPGAERFWSSYISEHPEIMSAVDQARMLLLNLQRAKQLTGDEQQISRVWRNIENGIRVDESKESFSFFRIAATVSVLIITSFAVWYGLRPATSSPDEAPEVFSDRNQFVKQLNNTGKTMTVHLSDGTEVALEDKSELIFKRTYSADSVRRVYLNGDAFFKVVKNPQQPFLVYSQELVTKVLGTSFRVRAFDGQEDVLVAVAEGKVSVYSVKERPPGAPASEEAEMKGVVLTSNQEVLYSRAGDAFNKSLVDTPQVVTGYNLPREFVFQNSSISEVFKTLEAAYGLEIIYQEEVMENCYLTVSLRDEPLFEKLKIICRTLGATYELIDAKIVINSKGC